ncbi:MAG: hypothetical protein NT135_02885 [Candidatus Berkelbacteria bacterium]|nr:hypothetical protein [Candidatus Berkelbacteria bacterium]
MDKNQIIITGIISFIFVVIISFGFSLIFKTKPKSETKEVIYTKVATITKDYNYHVKTFPAPYYQVGALPN